MPKIRVLIKDPGEPPRSTYIINTLENLQETVGGYIETVTLAEDLVIICNKEGRLKNLPYNCNICGIDFVGPIIIAGIKEDNFSDLPAGHNTIKRLLPHLWKNDTFEELEKAGGKF